MRNYLELGQWNVICDRCGFQFKSGMIKDEWTGLKVCKECWESRHPQTLIQVPKDDPSIPWGRPDRKGSYTYSLANSSSYIFTQMSQTATDLDTIQLTPTAVNGSHMVTQLNLIPNGSASYTFTLRVKPNGYNWVILQPSDATVYFNISTGAVGNSNLLGGDSSSITSAGDGWYNCSVTITSARLNPTNRDVAFNVTTANATVIFTGDGTSGAYWTATTTNTWVPGDNFVNVPYISSSIGHQT